MVEPGTTTADLSLPAALPCSTNSVGPRIDRRARRVFLSRLYHPLDLLYLARSARPSESSPISYGCTGWVHGMSVISALLATGEMKRGLLMAGDTSTQMNYPDDKESRPLFGDAATVTALEYSSECEPLLFNFGTEGKNYQAIITRDGGMRHPFSESSLVPVEYGRGIKRRNIDCKIDGMEVFAFSSFRGEQCVREFYSHFGVAEEEIDYPFPSGKPIPSADSPNSSRSAKVPTLFPITETQVRRFRSPSWSNIRDYRNRPLKTLYVPSVSDSVGAQFIYNERTLLFR